MESGSRAVAQYSDEAQHGSVNISADDALGVGTHHDSAGSSTDVVVDHPMVEDTMVDIPEVDVDLVPSTNFRTCARRPHYHSCSKLIKYLCGGELVC